MCHLLEYRVCVREEGVSVLPESVVSGEGSVHHIFKDIVDAYGFLRGRASEEVVAAYDADHPDVVAQHRDVMAAIIALGDSNTSDSPTAKQEEPGGQDSSSSSSSFLSPPAFSSSTSSLTSPSPSLLASSQSQTGNESSCVCGCGCAAAISALRADIAELRTLVLTMFR